MSVTFRTYQSLPFITTQRVMLSAATDDTVQHVLERFRQQAKQETHPPESRLLQQGEAFHSIYSGFQLSE